MPGPSGTARTLLDHLGRGEYVDAVALIDIRDLEQWRRGQLAGFAFAMELARTNDAPNRAPVSLAAIPDHHADIRPLLAKHARVVIVGMDGINNLAELAGLAGEDLLAGYWRLLAKTEGRERWAGTTVLGETIEGGQASAVCAMGSTTVGLALRRVSGEWKVRLTDDLTTPDLWVLLMHWHAVGAA